MWKGGRDRPYDGRQLMDLYDRLHWVDSYDKYYVNVD